jgi:hypothetical protein
MSWLAIDEAPDALGMPDIGGMVAVALAEASDASAPIAVAEGAGSSAAGAQAAKAPTRSSPSKMRGYRFMQELRGRAAPACIDPA